MDIKQTLPGDLNITAYGIVDASDRKDRPAPDPAEVAAAREWIRRRCGRRKTINRRQTSYRLKHLIEKQTGRYIGNGSVIQSALFEGYRIERIADGPNAVFNIRIG